MRTILVILFVLLYLILGLPVLGVEWIISKFNRPAADISQLRMVQWAFRVVCFLSGVKLTVKGEENVPKDQAVMYIGNHRSFFDIIITYARCPRLTGYIAKNGINKVPILNLWMKRLYCLFLDRKDLKQGLKVILTAIDQVRNGISMCVFPEGTRNRDTDQTSSLLPFHEGSFKIAQKTGCPIVPMALTGTADIFENHFPWIRKANVTLTYGKPILISDLPKEEQKKIGSHCQKVIQEMLEEELGSR
ncbi:MAG: lysophospholipid acyltransferase family protein [Agathobacter sp.]